MHLMLGLFGMTLLLLIGLVTMLVLVMTVLWQVRRIVQMSREINRGPESRVRPTFSWHHD